MFGRATIRLGVGPHSNFFLELFRKRTVGDKWHSCPSYHPTNLTQTRLNKALASTTEETDIKFTLRRQYCTTITDSKKKTRRLPSDTEIMTALAIELVLINRPNRSFHVLNAHEELV